MEPIENLDFEGQELPEALDDSADPLRPEIDEENSIANPPIAAPTQDMEVTEDKEEVSEADDASELSDVDEAQFEDFDPTAIAIEDRPAAIDETNVGLLGVHRRKRAEGEGGEKKKKREGRREKPKKRRARKDDDGEVSAGEEVSGRRERRKRERTKAVKPVEDEENLTPDERRRRALDRAMDAAVKNPNARRHKRAEGADEEEVEQMRVRMTRAAQLDAEAREKSQPAIHKLQLLPHVVALLNKNTLTAAIMEPEVNILEAVRFFLEPLPDGSMPAHNIQRELFTALTRLPVNKEALVASGIGKVTLFYTKSKRPEPSIKRMAERLMQEWSRPILRKTDDFRKRAVVEATYDPNKKLAQRPRKMVASSQAPGASQVPSSGLLRARNEGGPLSYSIAPVSQVPVGGYAKASGAGTDKQFNRIKNRASGKARGAR